MKIELDLQSPYQSDGSPRTDLPTWEVLAWDGNEWGIGNLKQDLKWIGLFKTDSNDLLLDNVVQFALLPTIIEQDDLF